MVFSSLLFVFAFLTPCLLIYTFVDKRYKNRVLLIFSLIFYAWGGIAFVGILVADAAICWFCARQIEAACGIPFTGIINNSNIGDETTREYVEESASWAKRVSKALRLRLVGTAVRRGLGLRGDGVFEIGLRRFAWQR